MGKQFFLSISCSYCLCCVPVFWIVLHSLRQRAAIHVRGECPMSLLSAELNSFVTGVASVFIENQQEIVFEFKFQVYSKQSKMKSSMLSPNRTFQHRFLRLFMQNKNESRIGFTKRVF
jgi:hypothetical protein